MTNTIPYLYQLQGTNYSTLSNTNFKVAVVDDDSSALTSSQISSLEGQGKAVFAYLAVGQAEPWRSYWNPNASYILGQDPLWGSYFVKFWDHAWQSLEIARATALVKEGYGGMVLDVVDVYNYPMVYNADGGTAKAKADMISFIGKLSDAVKAINPAFKVITNNGMDMSTSSAYMSKIDGINAESTFYLSDNSIPTWSSSNLSYLKNYTNAGKVVFAIDYPTSESAQLAYVDKAIAAGFIPFIGNTALSVVDSTNFSTYDKLNSTELSHLNSIISGSGGATIPPVVIPPVITQPVVIPPVTTTTNNTINGTSANDQIYASTTNDLIHGNAGGDYIDGGAGNDTIYGDDGVDYMFGGAGNDTLIGGAGSDGLTGGAGNDNFVFFKGAGNDWLNDFQGAGSTVGDTIQIASDIYSSATQALANVTYTGGNAVIKLDGTNSVTLAGVSSGLTVADFQIVDPLSGAPVGTSPTPTPTPVPTPTPTPTPVPTTNNTINGTSANDQIYASTTNDLIHGNAGGDYIDGGAGNDTIYGDDGVDYMFGGNGNDTLIGGAGSDGLTGGAGADKFAFTKGAGNDWLNDFHIHTNVVAERDIIQIASDIYSTAEQALTHVTYTGGSAVITLDGTNSVTLAGVSSGLTAADFQII